MPWARRGLSAPSFFILEVFFLLVVKIVFFLLGCYAPQTPRAGPGPSGLFLRLPPLMGPVDAWRPEASEGSNARPLGEHNGGAHRKCQMAVPSSLVGTRRVRQVCYCCDKGVRVRSWM